MGTKDKATPAIPPPIKGIFVARQPIFDAHEKLFGYELLFRSGFNNFYDNLDGDYATSKTIMNSFFMLGIDVITGGRMAFINFTQNLLLREIATIFPKELLAIEVLETIVPEDSVINSCRKLKRAGYLIVLDDFVYRPEIMPLIDLADIIKIDVKQTNPVDVLSVFNMLSRKRVKYLAEKVETKDEFINAREMGFSYFQGFFFSKPVIVEGKEIPGYKLTYLQILQQVNQPDVEFDELEHIIKRDVSLTYKLLRFINSAAFSFSTRIQSIKQALTLLGLKEIKKWVSLIALSGMGDDKPEELVISSMSRAKFGELISSKIGMKEYASDLFLLGMFSMLDAFIDQPMADIIADLPLAEPIKTALLNGRNAFREVLDLIIYYEKGEWDRCAPLIKKFNVEESLLPEIFATALEWAHRIFKH